MIHEALVRVRGTGFAPGVQVKIGIGYLPDQVTKIADANGEFSAAVQVSALPAAHPNASSWVSAPVIADLAGGGRIRSSRVNYAVRAFEVWLDNGFGGDGSYERWNDRLTVDAAGLPINRPVFAHWVQSTGGGSRTVATRYLGMATGPCGALHHVGEVFPYHPSKAEGNQRYQIDFGPNVRSLRPVLHSWAFRLYPQ